MNLKQLETIQRFIEEQSSFEKELSSMARTDVDYDYLLGQLDARKALELRLLAYQIVDDN